MGAAAILAAPYAAAVAPALKAVGVMAPGFWGADQMSLITKHACDMGKTPFLLLVGDQDCANGVQAQALPVWKDITQGTTACTVAQSTGARRLVDLVGATHCQWSQPVKGACDFDKPCSREVRLERTLQQQRGLK